MVGPENVSFTDATCMVAKVRTDSEVTCPHCGGRIALQGMGAREPRLSITCPRCSRESLLVRVVSVLHQAVRMPSELVTQLRMELEENMVDTSVRTPKGLFSLSVSRGAVVLLAMLWQRAEHSGSMKVEASVTQLAQQLLSSRGMVRRWLNELVEVEVLRELSGPGESPRVWELLPIPEARKEVGRG